jgi:hypothetical protein
MNIDMLGDGVAVVTADAGSSGDVAIWMKASKGDC